MRLHTLLKAIALVSVGIFLFCQILGSWCPMLQAARAEQPTIQHLHSGHMHANHAIGESMCPDSLTSTRYADSSSVGSLSSGQLALVLASLVELVGVSFLSKKADAVAEPEQRLPLYTLLSTFRI